MITIIHRLTSADGYAKVLTERTVKVATDDRPSVGHRVDYAVFDGDGARVKGRVVACVWSDEGLTLVVEQTGAVA
jgi:hypothetical protein